MSNTPGKFLILLLTCTCIFLLIGSGCKIPNKQALEPIEHYTPPGKQTEEETEIQTSLINSVEFLSNSANNYESQIRAMNQAWALGMKGYMSLEAINNLSNQKNILIKIPGKNEPIVYIVAHYDTASNNPLFFISNLFHGVLDQVASASSNSTGALDNSSGVALALALAHYIKKRDAPLFNTYHFLLCGGNKAGLKGSRSHVAGLSKKNIPAIELTINFDTIGSRYAHNAVDLTVSDEALSQSLIQLADRRAIPLKNIREPSAHTGDYEPFKRNNFFYDIGRSLRHHLITGLVPQKSWFTESYSIPVLSLTSSRNGRIAPATMPDLVENVDQRRLFEIYTLMTQFIEEFDLLAEARESARKKKHEEILKKKKAREAS